VGWPAGMSADARHRSLEQGLAALRDCDRAYVRYGSKAAEMIASIRRAMSALPRKRTNSSHLGYIRFVPGTDIPVAATLTNRLLQCEPELRDERGTAPA
jgi:hypothetical protein